MDVENSLDVLLLLLRAQNAKEIEGITRIQKMMFLLDQTTDLPVDLEFKQSPYGPVSLALLEGIRQLKALKLIESYSLKGVVSGDEDRRIVKAQDQQAGHGAFQYPSRRFELTEKGQEVSHELQDSLTSEVLNSLDDFKERWNPLTLGAFLLHVYQQAPDFCTDAYEKPVETILKSAFN